MALKVPNPADRDRTGPARPLTERNAGRLSIPFGLSRMCPPGELRVLKTPAKSGEPKPRRLNPLMTLRSLF